MSKLIRAVYALKHTLFAPQGFRRGLSEPSSQIRNFSSKGKRKFKSRGNVFGDGNMSKKDLALQQTVPVVSTGSFYLDMALGIGGLPKGHIVEIYGPEASGKTSLALHIIAEAQKQGGYSAFIDAEHALDPALAKTCGVNIDSLLLSRPDSGEQALSLVDTLIRSQSVDVVVIDSVAGLVPKDELDGEMGDAHMAMQARLMKRALSKLSHSVSLSQTILVFINQLRAKFSTFGRSGGPTEVTLGGNALKFYASVRLDIRRIGSIERGGEIIGNQVQVEIVKNNYAPPCRIVQFELIFGEGIYRESEIADLAIQLKIVQKSEGSEYYSFNDQKFLSEDAFKRYLAANDDIREELATKLRQKVLDSDPEKEPTNEA